MDALTRTKVGYKTQDIVESHDSKRHRTEKIYLESHVVVFMAITHPLLLQLESTRCRATEK